MEFTQLIMDRRSVRSYDGEKQVTADDIQKIFEAVTQAPSWKNSQTGHYYILLSGEKLEALRSAGLPEFNQKNSAGAALVVATYKKDIAGFGNGEPTNELGNQWGAYDLGLSTAYLCLAAKDLGLDTLIMGIRDAAAIRSVLDIPEEEVIVSVLALGYRAGEPRINNRKDPKEFGTIVE